MRIAILTLPLYANYGGILQCYALQTVLERNGHEVKVLAKPLYSRYYYLVWLGAIIKRSFKRFILKKDIPSIIYAFHQLERKNVNIFIKKYINHYVLREWNEKLSRRFDAFVVGSDQVWRPIYAKNIEDYFLAFLKDTQVKRISYAASFGVDNVDEYSSDKLRECTELLRKFNAVSVREYSGIELCRNYFKSKAVHLLDPTLLLDRKDYLSLVEKEYVQEPLGNMLVYILDKTEEKISLIDEIAKERGMKPYWLDNIDSAYNGFLPEQSIKVSVEQWIYGFEKSDFVFTDSFHGCVFSIIFKKKFLVIGNEERGMERFFSLLNTFKLSDRLIYNIETYNRNKEIIFTDIDFNKVYNILESEREKALKFISKFLS